MFINADLGQFDLKSLGCKFDVILIDPPLGETCERSAVLCAEEFMNIKVPKPEGGHPSHVDYEEQFEWKKEDLTKGLENRDAQVFGKSDTTGSNVCQPASGERRSRSSSANLPQPQHQKQPGAESVHTAKSSSSGISQHRRSSSAQQYARPPPKSGPSTVSTATAAPTVTPIPASASTTPTITTVSTSFNHSTNVAKTNFPQKRVWTWDDVANLKIEEISSIPSFVFLWIGDSTGLERGREILAKWGYRRAEVRDMIQYSKTEI
jgi:hypothetical protein